MRFFKYKIVLLHSMEDEKKAKYIQMTTQPPEKLVCSFAVPSIVSMLISSLYNMVDTLFVGRIDTQSTAALGIIFSYMAIVQAFAFFFGQGSANYVSRALGSRNYSGASQMVAMGFFSAFFFSIVIACLGLIFMDPLLRFFGSTPTILPKAEDYFIYILIGTPFISTTFVMNNQMRLQGNAMMAMIGISAGAILNIGLDPLFIFGFDMGVGGAGLATAISQAVSFFVMFHLTGKRGGIAIRFRNFHPSWAQLKEISAGGSPSLARQGLGGMATMLLNQLAGGYGDAAVAAFSIVGRYMLFVSSALIGFGQGFQPVCGFNFGAKLYDRVRKAFRFSTITAICYCILFAIIGYIWAPGIISLFRSGDMEVIKIGSDVLRYQCITYPLVSFIIMSNMYLQNIKKTTSAILVAMSRQGIFLIPAMFVGKFALGLNGVIIAQPISDVFAFLMSMPLCLKALKGMK